MQTPAAYLPLWYSRMGGNHYLTILITFFCCITGNLHAQQVEKIYLNPKTPAIQKQGSFVDSLEFTPLAPAGEDKINEYVNIEVTRRYLLIKDYSAGMLYIYTRKGAFVKSINYKAKAESLYPSYNTTTGQIVFFGNNKNYSLTPKDRVEIQLDWNNPHNLKYFRKYVIDLNDTTFTIRKEKPDKYNLMGAYPLADGRYIQTKINTSPLYKDSTGYELSVIDKDRLVKTAFPYNRVNEPKFLFSEENLAISATDTPSVSYLTRPYCDTIYKWTKDSVFPVYQLVMPLENSLPTGFFTKTPSNRNEKENFKRNNGWMFQQVNAFYETSRLIYLTVRFFSHFDVFIYDKQTHTAYSSSKIKPDAGQYNLLLLKSFNTLRVGKRFYKLVPAEQLVSFFKDNPGTTVPKELAAFLEGQPDKNAMVMVSFTIKD